MRYTEIPAAYVRGGTSRAVLFRLSDLPTDKSQWAPIFRSVLGSPDTSGRQLDGFGGGISSLSKVAVVGPSARDGFDVDYHFFQIEPRSGNVQTDATCGNIVSSVGPFAIENGWAEEVEGVSKVRIFDVNSQKAIVSSFDDANLTSIDGVPGQAPEIRLTFENPGGAVSKGLFPTGLLAETLHVESVGPIEVTLIDATLPTVVVSAASLGLRGDETPSELSDPRMIALSEKIRVAAGLKMGLTESCEVLHNELSNMPDVVVVSPTPGLNSIQARFFSGGGAHRASPVTSSIALACSCQLQGTVSSTIASGQRPHDGVWEIKHPAGSMYVTVTPTADNESIGSATVTRTTRVVMVGNVRLPAGM